MQFFCKTITDTTERKYMSTFTARHFVLFMTDRLMRDINDRQHDRFNYLADLLAAIPSCYAQHILICRLVPPRVTASGRFRVRVPLAAWSGQGAAASGC